MENQIPPTNNTNNVLESPLQSTRPPAAPMYFYLSVAFLIVSLVAIGYAFMIFQSPKSSVVQISEITPTTYLDNTETQITPSLEPTTKPAFVVTPEAQSVPQLTGMPDGFKVKDTLCYSLFVPETSVVGADNKCNLYFSTGQDFPLSIVIQGIFSKGTGAKQSLQDMTTSRIPFGDVISESNVLIDGLQAKLIVEKSHPTNGDEVHRYFVDVTSKNYEVSGYPVDGLEFQTVIVNGGDKEAELTTYRNLIMQSVKWK